MPESPSGRTRRPRRSYAIPLLVVAVAAAGFNLRTAITSLPPLFPELHTALHLSSASQAVLATVPVLCFGVVSGAAAPLKMTLPRAWPRSVSITAWQCSPATTPGPRAITKGA